MPTYAGYQAISTPDLSAPFREQMAGLMNKRALEAQQASEIAREQLKLQKAADDKFDAQFWKDMDEISKQAVIDTPDKNLADFVYDGVINFKDYAINMKQSGMNQRQLNLLIQNAKSDLQNLKTYQDGLGEVATEQKKMIDNQEAGWRMLYAVGENEKKINLNNKRIGWDDSGHMYLETVDMETGQARRSESVRNLTSAYNIQDQFVKRANWDEYITNVIDEAPDFTFTSGNKTITDPTKNKNWNGWLNDKIDFATDSDNPERLVDILMDGGLSSSVKLDNGVDFQIFGNGISDINQMGAIYEQALKKAEAAKGSVLTVDEANKIQEEIDKMTFAVTETGGKYKFSMKAETKDFIRGELKDRVTNGLTIKQTKSGDGGNSSDYNSLSSYEKQGVEVAWAVDQEWVNKSGKFEGFKKNNLSYEWDPQGKGVWVTPRNFDELDDEIKQIFGGESRKILISNKRELSQFVGSSTPSSALASYSTGIGLINNGVKPGWMEVGDVQTAPVSEATKRAREAAQEWKREKSQNVNKLKGGNVR